MLVYQRVDALAIDVLISQILLYQTFGKVCCKIHVHQIDAFFHNGSVENGCA